MRPDFGQLAIVIGGWVLLIAIIVAVVIAAKKLIRYIRQREADRNEMLELAREQGRRR